MRVGPVAIDDQRIRLAGFQDRPDFLARLEPALDSTRVEQEREPSPVGGPEFFVQLEERRVDRLARRRRSA